MNRLTSELSRRARSKAVFFLILGGTILWIPVIGLLFGNTPGFLRDLGFYSGPRGTPLAWVLALLSLPGHWGLSTEYMAGTF